MKTAIIATVYNEERNIERFLSSIASQTRLPDECVIVDGGSSDRTAELIQKWCARYPFIRLIVQRCNIAQGRNIAIAACSAEIVACTDAGCSVDPAWFENIVAPIEQGVARAVTGNFAPSGSAPIQKALAVAGARRRKPESNFPSSRSFAFLRSLWQDYPYPEHLAIHEDTKLCSSWAERGVKFHFQPLALVSWELERDFSGIFKKYSRYAFWWAYSGDPIDRVRRFVIAFYALLVLLAALGLPLAALLIWSLYWGGRVLRGGGALETVRFLGPAGLAATIPVLLTLDWCSIYGVAKGKLFRLYRPLTAPSGRKP